MLHSEAVTSVAGDWLAEAQSLTQTLPTDWNVRRNPNNPAEWLRRFPLGHLLDQTRLSTVEFMTMYNKHIDALSNAGIAIPGYSYAVVDEAVEGRIQPVLYGAVQHVVGKPVSEVRDFKLQQQVAVGLRAYLDWAHMTQQRFVLSDIWELKQYVADAQAGHTHPCLIDLEPYFSPPTTNNFRWELSQSRFAYWSRLVDAALQTGVQEWILVRS